MKTKYDLKILLSSKTFVKLSKLSFICVFSAFEKSRVAYNNLSGEHDIDAARDAHVGEYDSEEDFAYEILEECDYYGMPENMRHYFNVSRSAEDLFDFDYYFENGHVFNRC